MLNSEDKIKRLNRIGIALTSTTNLSELFELIVTESRRFTGADGGSLFTVEGEILIFRVAQTESIENREKKPPPLKAFPLPLDKKSVAGYVAITGEVINVEDCYDLDPAKGPVVNRSFDRIMKYRSKSMLAVPMQDDKGCAIGVIQLINALNENGGVIPFSKESEELMLSIASQAAVALRNAKLISDIKNILAAYVKYSATAIDARSPHTAGHSRRVAGLAMRIAKAINEQTKGDFANVHFSDAELEELWFAAWLHDIGKIGIRESVLEKNSRVSLDKLESIIARLQNYSLEQEIDLLKNDNTSDNADEIRTTQEKIKSYIEALHKINNAPFLTDDNIKTLDEIAALKYRNPDNGYSAVLDSADFQKLSIRKGNLTDEEWQEMRSHVGKTRTLIKSIPFTTEMSDVAEIASNHHEMLDGSGYPSKLKAKNISLRARILAVTDIFDALIATDRPYKKAVPLEKTIEILNEESERGRLDRRIVNLIIKKELYLGHKEDQAEYPWTRKLF